MERERRHFAETRDEERYKVQGRRYIPHGVGDQPPWRPHGKHLKPQYTEYGPDWQSRLRYIPPPQNPNAKPIIKFPGIRYYPYNTLQTDKEWSFYPEGYHTGKRCVFEVEDVNDAIHMSTIESSNELSHKTLYGKKRPICSVWQVRGGLPWASPGDKSYQVCEYSPDFHKSGSTRPVVHFGGGEVKAKPDTFVPLLDLPPLSESYTMKEKRRQLRQEMDLVQSLDNYRPSSPLVPPPLPDDRRPMLTSMYN
ncbi:spermatogenesis-associated serine-rich protein 1-like [Saccoglossus kowalevskii]